MGEPVFIKYGSPSVSSGVTTHKQRDIKIMPQRAWGGKTSDFLWSWQWLSLGAIKSRQLSQRYSAKPGLPASPPKSWQPLCVLDGDLNADWTQMLRSDSDGHRRVTARRSTIAPTRKGHASKERGLNKQYHYRANEAGETVTELTIPQYLC